jgi:hypothetical protein
MIRVAAVMPSTKFSSLKAWFCLPSTDTQQASFLQYIFSPMMGAGRPGIVVSNKGGLPLIGQPGVSYTLSYTSYQSVPPANPTWTVVPLVVDTWGNFEYSILDAFPTAYYQMFLTAVTPTGNIAFAILTTELTSDDSTVSAAQAALNGSNLIPNCDNSCGPVPGVAGNCIYDTTGQPFKGYLGTRYVRSTALAVGDTAAITNKIPCLAGDFFNCKWYSCILQSGITGEWGGNLILTFYDINGNSLGPGLPAGIVSEGRFQSLTGWTPGQWGMDMKQVEAPAKTAYLIASLPNYANATYWFDYMILQAVATPASAASLGPVKAGAGILIGPDGTISSSGPVGAAAWGAITGAMESQSDLATALAALAPLAGGAFTGPISAPKFSGSGAGLTGIPASAIIGGLTLRNYDIDGGGAFDIASGPAIDGGHASSVYGGVPPLDCGGAT